MDFHTKLEWRKGRDVKETKRSREKEGEEDGRGRWEREGESVRKGGRSAERGERGIEEIVELTI